MTLLEWLKRNYWTEEKLAWQMDYTKFHVHNVLIGKSRMCDKFKRHLIKAIGPHKFDDLDLMPPKKGRKKKNEAAIPKTT